MSELAIERSVTPTLAKTANVLAKGALVLLLVRERPGGIVRGRGDR